MNHRRVAMLLSNPFRPDPRVLKEASSLAESGYRVTIVCWDRAAEMKPEEVLESGVRVIRIQNIASTYGVGARQLFRLPRFWLEIFPMLNALKPDVVHCHDFDTLPAGLLWGKFQSVPVVYDAHEYYADLCKPRLYGIGGALLYQLIRMAEYAGAHLASSVITVDETLGAIYRRLNRKVVIIGHYPNRAMAVEGAPVFARSQVVLIYIGRLSVDRGLLVYADLLRTLCEWGIPARLWLCGVFTPPDEENRLRERCRGLEDVLDVLGWVHYSQVPALLRDADVGLAILQPEPRYVAALPVKLFEYMAAGLPVVASDFPQIAAVLDDAQCGIPVDPLDSRAVANRIRHWWEHPDEARTKGESGRQAVLDRYNWEVLAQRLEDLYDSLLE